MSESPTIDGVLDDEIWNQVEWTSDFIETQPEENTPPRFQTKLKVLYDDRNIYFALRCYDQAPDSIVSRLSRRDGFQGDRVNVILDSYFDKRTAFLFTVTAAGVKGDEVVTGNGSGIDDSWNPVWYAGANIDEEGWTGEMKIPLTQLRFGNKDEHVWGLNVSRLLFRDGERSSWNRVRVDAPGFISECGELRGLRGIKPQRQLEVQPFVVLQGDFYPQVLNNPYRTGYDRYANAGLDAKVGITNDLTLDLTINPDFGQVEADPGAISLDGFQIFYREQRPFFIENKNIFDYTFAEGNDNLFYSRRIGRAPQLDVTTSAFSKRPRFTTILGAAKFSGKTKDGWSIGVLESLTNKAYERFINSNGEEEQVPIEPLTNYFVGRIQKDFNNKNTFVGGMLTSTHRFNNLGVFKGLVDDAFTGGLDFKHQWNRRTYYLTGNIIGSHVSGSSDAISRLQKNVRHLYQRVDARHLSYDSMRTFLAGSGGKLEFGKAGSGHWRYRIGAAWRSPGLELNDVGFLRNADEVHKYSTLSYRILKPTKHLRSFKSSWKLSSHFDFSGKYNSLKLSCDTDLSWHNQWSLDVGFGYKPFRYLNEFLRGGPRLRFSQSGYVYTSVNSNRSKKLWTRLGFVYGAAVQQQSGYRKVSAKVNYQPLSALGLSLETAYIESPNRAAYVTRLGGAGASPLYVLGKIDNKEINMALRVNYSINANLSIQYYASPYHARGIYSAFNYVLDAEARDLYKRLKWFSNTEILYDESTEQYAFDVDGDGTWDHYINNPNFNYIQFRSNLVLRWEYVPGSELYFVWAQGGNRYGNGSLGLWKGLSGTVFQKALDQTFLIKATYRFRT